MRAYPGLVGVGEVAVVAPAGCSVASRLTCRLDGIVLEYIHRVSDCSCCSHHAQRLTRPSLACSLPRRRSAHPSQRPRRPSLACRRARPSRRLLSLVRCGHQQRACRAEKTHSPTCIRGARGGRRGSPVPLPGGVFLRGETAPGCCRRWLCHGGRDYGIFYGAHSFAHCISLRRAKGRDKVEAIVGYVIYIHVDLLITFLLLALLVRSRTHLFILPSFPIHVTSPSMQG